MKIELHLNFITQFFLRDIKNRYNNSFLGLSWSIISPLVMIALYSIIFSNVLTVKLGIEENKFNYVNYLCIGIIAWNLLSEFINKSINIFRENSNIIKKLNFFKIHLLLSSMLSALFNYIIILIIFFLYLIVSSKIDFSFNFILFLLVLIAQIIFVFSLGLLLASINIYIPDTEHFFKIFLQIWFWITPIVYPISIVPDFLKVILLYNPFYYFLKYYHDIFVYKNITNIFDYNLVYFYFFNLVFFGLSVLFYSKIKKNIVDEL
tara:strand:+ start:3796 stop:4584 length:789 start_codon:yes stop_codon:yes gene_type:complete